MRNLVLSLSLTLSVLMSGCGDPVAGLEYRGDPLAVVRGQVLLSGPQAPAGQLFVVAAWRTEEDPHDRWTAEVAEASGGFPASYSLTLLQPPPVQALNTDPETGGRLGFAFLALMEDGDGDGAVDVSSQQMPSGPDRFRGGTETILLAYAADPFPADSKIGQALGGALEAGYHLMQADEKFRCSWDQAQQDWACPNARTELSAIPLSTPVDLKVIEQPSEWAPVHSPDWLFLQ